MPLASHCQGVKRPTLFNWFLNPQERTGALEGERSAVGYERPRRQGGHLSEATLLALGGPARAPGSAKTGVKGFALY